MKTSRANLMQM